MDGSPHPHPIPPPHPPHPTHPQVRGSSAEGFGKGRTRRMPLAAFLARLRAGDASLYLSSQQQPVAADGFPELLAPPLAALRGRLPLRPALMGHLVPQQVCVWWCWEGVGGKPAQSGLCLVAHQRHVWVQALPSMLVQHCCQSQWPAMG